MSLLDAIPSPIPRPVMSTNRLEALSDGVFAIVITLLVLDLRLPPGHGDLEARLLSLWPRLLAYAFTFIVVGIYWAGHHALFTLVQRVDKTLLWLNIFLLMAVCFIPFPAAILGAHPLDPTAMRLYAGNLVAVGLGFILCWGYASRCHRLIPEGLDKGLVQVAWARTLLAPTAYTAAFFASYGHPYFSVGVLTFVPILYIWPSRFDHRHLRV
ncbi:MAG TPA: TMEM175 family protein [Holophagaceae bacterium]|nr:TMEM175 family protein [Holophagaceae bacterium]